MGWNRARVRKLEARHPEVITAEYRKVKRPHGRVLVDYNHDQFAGVFVDYFPHEVTVRPGDTVHFKQAWNGEPHSVTMGTLVNHALGIVNPLLEKYPNGEGAPPGTEEQFQAAFKDLPFMFGNGNNADTVNQSTGSVQGRDVNQKYYSLLQGGEIVPSSFWIQ